MDLLPIIREETGKNLFSPEMVLYQCKNKHTNTALATVFNCSNEDKIYNCKVCYRFLPSFNKLQFQTFILSEMQGQNNKIESNTK